jgi:hypothetical protein
LRGEDKYWLDNVNISNGSDMSTVMQLSIMGNMTGNLMPLREGVLVTLPNSDSRLGT